MKIKYDAILMKYMSYFETVTKTRLKDCFVDTFNTLVFVVPQEDIGKAIGKNGATFRALESRLKRRIKIIAFSDVPEKFIANMIQPHKVKDIVIEDGIVTITPDPQSRGYIIGRAAQNLRNYETIVQRYFDIKEIKVV